MSMPSAVRHINEVRVLDVVFRHGRVSRANIARELGITRSTASSLVAGLAEDGLLMEDTSEDDKSAGTGRPGTFVRLNPHHALFVGADIGVGRITVAAMDFAGSIVSERHFPLASHLDAKAVLRNLSASVREVVEPLSGSYGVKGLCVTVPGVIDKSGIVLRAPFLGWRNVPILEILTALLPEMPVIAAENDANAFAFAENYRNRHPGGDTEVYIFLDAGIGGAIISGGQILRGHDGYAGELGHMVLGDRGFVETATLPGSFESFIGRDAILARYRHHGGGAAGDIEKFLDMAREGDAAALAAMHDWAFYLGRGLAIISNIFNPSRVVLGGPVARLFQLCAEDILRNTRRNLLDDHPVPEVVLSTLGLDGPALGGASMLHHDMISVDEDLVFRKGQPNPAAARLRG